MDNCWDGGQVRLHSVQKGYPQPNMNLSDYDAYSRSPAAWQNPNTVRPCIRIS